MGDTTVHCTVLVIIDMAHEKIIQAGHMFNYFQAIGVRRLNLKGYSSRHEYTKLPEGDGIRRLNSWHIERLNLNGGVGLRRLNQRGELKKKLEEVTQHWED